MGRLQSPKPDWPEDILRCLHVPALPVDVNQGSGEWRPTSPHSPAIEAGLLGAILPSALLVQLELAMQDLEMQKVAFLPRLWGSGQGGPGAQPLQAPTPLPPQLLPEQPPGGQDRQVGPHKG